MKTIKKKWKSKKIALICFTVLIAIIMSAVAIVGFNHFAYQEQICVNGTIYTQKGDNTTELPDNSVELGYLKEITHRNTDSPSKDFTATNLDEKYAGCPIYQSGEIIYLEDYSGFYIPFKLTK